MPPRRKVRRVASAPSWESPQAGSDDEHDRVEDDGSEGSDGWEVPLDCDSGEESLDDDPETSVEAAARRARSRFWIAPHSSDGKREPCAGVDFAGYRCKRKKSLHENQRRKVVAVCVAGRAVVHEPDPDRAR